MAFAFLLAVFTKPELNPAEGDFVVQCQQLAPAVMAKGVEDTTFYCFDRLLSCNEVGASPSLVGIPTEQFHEYCHYLGDCWPNNQLATSTHDNKRSEDVRTRISVLTEIPDRWTQALHVVKAHRVGVAYSSGQKLLASRGRYQSTLRCRAQCAAKPYKAGWTPCSSDGTRGSSRIRVARMVLDSALAARD
jgi:maltooligosyltrehalose synthase